MQRMQEQRGGAVRCIEIVRHLTEEQLQELVAAWLDLCGVQWCHVPNGGKRHKAVARKMKLAGQKAGVPDVLIFEPWESTAFVPGVGGVDRVTTDGMGLAVELKVNTRAGKKTYPRPEQRAWLDALERRGWRVAVCRSLKEVQDVCQCLRPLSGREMPF